MHVHGGCHNVSLNMEVASWRSPSLVRQKRICVSFELDMTYIPFAENMTHNGEDEFPVSILCTSNLGSSPSKAGRTARNK